MWGDMPWFVYMHHNHHLVKDLMDAPLVARPFSNHAVQGASSLLRSAASLSTSAGGFFRSFLQSTPQPPDSQQTETNADIQRVSRSTRHSVGQSSSESGPGYGVSRAENTGVSGVAAPSCILPSASSSVPATLQRNTNVTGLPEACVKADLLSQPSISSLSVSAGADLPKVSSSVNACIDSQGIPAVRAPEGVCLKASPALRPPVYPLTSQSSPWACWLETDKRNSPSLQCSVRRCQSRASSTGVAVWGGTACCIGEDGSVACFYLGEALQKCSTGKLSQKEKSGGALLSVQELTTRGCSIQNEGSANGATVSEGEAGAEKVGRRALFDSEKRVGVGCIHGSSRFQDEEGVRKGNIQGVPNSEGEEEDSCSIDVSVLRSLAVYRLSSVPLCSTTFVGSTDVVAVGAFDGSIALHAVHTPQLDPFVGSRLSESEEEESISTTRTRPSLNSVASAAARTSFPKGAEPSAGSVPASALGSASFLPQRVNRKSSALLSGLALSRPLSRQVCHADSVLALAYNPTLHLLASASSDATVRVWDVATLLSSSSSSSSSNSLLLLQQVLDEHEGEVTAVAMHRHFLFSGNEDGVLLLFDLRLPSQRCGPVWGVHTAGNVPVQSCGISDCTAAAFLECASSLGFSSGAATVSDFSDVPSSLFGSSYEYFQHMEGTSPLSPYCAGSPSACFPIQFWDLRGKSAGIPPCTGNRAQHHQSNYFLRKKRDDGEENENSVGHQCPAEGKQKKPLCGVFDPTVQFGFLAGIRRKISPGEGQGTEAVGAVDHIGGGGRKAGGESLKARRTGKYCQTGKDYEGFVGLYDLRTKKEEISWSLQYITEPTFMAASPSTAELAVMGGGSDGGGFSLGSSYVVVGDVQGNVEVLATGEVCKRKTWSFT